MDLFTRCPHCDTVFRVTTGHLQASGGQVRCGRCEAVFDAFASLTAKPPGESQPKARVPADVEITQAESGAVTEVARPTEADVSQSEQELAAGRDAAPEPAVPPIPARDEVSEAGEPAPAPVAQQEEDERSDTQPAMAEQPDGTETPPERQSGPTPATTDDDSANLFEWEFKPAPNMQARARLWASLTVLLLLGALAQAAFVFRSDILVTVPQSKVVYEQLCQWLSCEIGLPRLAEQLNIEASDLQLVDTAKPNLVKLTALVRNRARVAVEYPAFELTLTNAREQVVARRVFFPSEYLASGLSEDTGLPARQELAINLFLDTGPLRAAGYRIYLFYPS